MRIDFHTHSNFSDGTLTPEALVAHAESTGIGAMSLTDHDTVGGLEKAASEAGKRRIRFLNGVEISGRYSGGTLHILGYGFDPNVESFKNSLSDYAASRSGRNQKILEKLRSSGIEISLEEVIQKNDIQDGIVGRPHIAKLLIEKGAVANFQQAFDQYLGYGGLAYFDKEVFSAGEAIDHIHSAGGKAFVAHPVSLNLEWADMREYLKKLREQGLDGIEIHNSSMTRTNSKQLETFAEDLGLYRSGGSDFHGMNKSNVQMGRGSGQKVLDSSMVSYDFFQSLFLTQDER